MNKTSNTTQIIKGNNYIRRSFHDFLQLLLDVKGLMNFDVYFLFSDTHHEKLPIVYANIRV